MAPNPRVVNAFRTMQELGITADVVKPVLKELLRIYEKNWNLIEAENYRVLADAIFEYEESKKGEREHKNNPEPDNDNNIAEDGRKPDESRKPLKRLRLKHQDDAVPCNDKVLGDSGESSSKRPKIDNCGLPGNSNPQLYPEKFNSSEINVRGARGESLVDSPSMRFEPKGKQHASSQYLLLRESPYLKEPKSEPGLDVCPPKEVPSRCMLLKPKDEPFTDDASNTFLHPISVIPPGDSSNRNGSGDEMNGIQTCQSQSRKSKSRGDGIWASSADRNGHGLVSTSQDFCGSVDIASSSIGDVQISLKCNYVGRPGFHTPSLNSVLELVEDRCRSAYNVDSSFSVTKLMNDICNSCLELGSQSASKPQHQDSEKAVAVEQQALIGKGDQEIVKACVSTEVPTSEVERDPAHVDCMSDLIHLDETGMISDDRNELIDGHGQDGSVLGDASPLKDPSDPVRSDQNGVITSDQENENINGEESNDVAAGEPTDTSCGSAKPKFDVEDITKGQELVKISLVNEVDKSPPPSFFYIPQNLKYQSACVNVLLARIGDDDCCSDCSGDCLSSKIPCACAQETGGEFAYTSDGLVKGSILEECISMNRDPKKHCQFYCKDNECPLERPKSGDMVEPCKGHLVRKFIKECWSKCGCDRQCGNRVVQRGITRNLQVFMTPKGKGWGLRTLEDLPKGAFVCEYVGEILTNAELYERNMKSTLKHAYPVLLDADWGSEKVLKDEEALCLDATIFGNVARFINHRCFDSNMVEIPVEVETPDRHYYHLAFFTTRDVAAMEELTWDYGIDFDDQEHPVKAFRCSCGSKFCRNIKRTRRRRIR